MSVDNQRTPRNAAWAARLRAAHYVLRACVGGGAGRWGCRRRGIWDREEPTVEDETDGGRGRPKSEKSGSRRRASSAAAATASNSKSAAVRSSTISRRRPRARTGVPIASRRPNAGGCRSCSAGARHFQIRRPPHRHMGASVCPARLALRLMSRTDTSTSSRCGRRGTGIGEHTRFPSRSDAKFQHLLVGDDGGDPNLKFHESTSGSARPQTSRRYRLHRDAARRPHLLGLASLVTIRYHGG